MQKIFFSETTRPRVLIFDIYDYLVNFYQVCSNYIPGAKNGPAPGVTCFYIRLYREQHEKIFLSETTRPRVLIFGM